MSKRKPMIVYLATDGGKKIYRARLDSMTIQQGTTRVIISLLDIVGGELILVKEETNAKTTSYLDDIRLD